MASVEESMPSMDDSSNTSSTQITGFRGKSDPAWNHCREAPKLSGNTKRMKLACLYCGKSFAGGGINRFKQHLAGVKGEVEPCRKVPADIRHQMIQNIQAISEKKKRTKEMGEDYNPFNARHKEHEEQVYYRQLGEDDDIQEIPPSSNKSADNTRGKNIEGGKEKQLGTIGNYFMPRTTPGAQPTIKSLLQNKEAVERCDLAVCMIDAIASMEPGYKAPNFHSVRGYLLTKNVDEVKKGTVFLKSVDASNISKTADMLYKLFKKIIMSVGFENVVHVVTDNAANYVAASKKLEQNFPTLFWSPCAAHCLNLIMQDIGKLVLVKNTVAHAADILNLKDLDGDDGENDGNDANRREDGGDENIATQEDVFANIDINFSPLA
ncbi:uncharacterized protein [Elaeis guineensis]|uniref:uncharacterized protein n=1 Tax=Elaeis guineensis var. tenera TaxID=51953 RepID=UPI003C6D306B